MAEGGLSDEELLKRLSSIYGEAYVAGVAMELADARTAVYTSESGMDEAVAVICRVDSLGMRLATLVRSSRRRWAENDGTNFGFFLWLEEQEPEAPATWRGPLARRMKL